MNAVIGLVRRDGINTPLLHEHGYDLVGLEVAVKPPGGGVVIDVVIGNGETAHVMPVEAKSGKNIEDRQARRYQKLSAKDLIRACHITLSSMEAPGIEVVYACLGEHVDTICHGLAGIESEFPVLAVYNDKIVLHNEQYAAGVLRRAFAKPHLLKAPPARLLPWDHETEDKEVIERDVLAVLVKCQSQRVQEVTIHSLAEWANPLYALFGRKAKSVLCGKVTKAAEAVSRRFPNTYQFVPAPTNDQSRGLVRILRTPEDNDPRGRTQGYRALARRRPRRSSSVHPGQEDLLRLIEAVEDVGDTDGETEEADETEGDG